MADTPQNTSATDSSSTTAVLPDGLDEQEEILIRLSQEMDNYFACSRFGKIKMMDGKERP